MLIQLSFIYYNEKAEQETMPKNLIKKITQVAVMGWIRSPSPKFMCLKASASRPSEHDLRYLEARVIIIGIS